MEEAPENTVYRREVSPGGRVSYVPYAMDETFRHYEEGAWIVLISPGHQTAKRLVEPETEWDAAAAFEEFKTLLMQELAEAASWKPDKRPLTPEQKEAWDALNKAMGCSVALTGSCLYDVVDSALDKFKAKIEEHRDATIR